MCMYIYIYIYVYIYIYICQQDLEKDEKAAAGGTPPGESERAFGDKCVYIYIYIFVKL